MNDPETLDRIEDAAIRIENLNKSFSQQQVLKNVSMSVEKGSISNTVPSKIRSRKPKMMTRAGDTRSLFQKGASIAWSFSLNTRSMPPLKTIVRNNKD